MTNPLYVIEKLPTTSAAAIREFNDRFIGAIAAAPASGWVDQAGALIPTASPMITFPVSNLRSKFQQTLGESRVKSLGEKSFDVKSQEFDDGYEARLMDLFQQSFAYRRWQQAPAALVMAEERFRHQKIAALLEAGESTAYLDGTVGVNFFSAAHPCNLFKAVGTFSNYQASPKDVASVTNIQAEATIMRGVLDENGDKLGVKPDTLYVPTEKFEPVNNLLAQALILDSTGVAAVTNPYANRWKVVEVPELTDPNDWYMGDSKLMGEFSPWVSLRQTVPASLGLRWFDETSDFFLNTGKLRVSAHIWYGFSLGLPHAIRKVVGA